MTYVCEKEEREAIADVKKWNKLEPNVGDCYLTNVTGRNNWTAVRSFSKRNKFLPGQYVYVRDVF